MITSHISHYAIERIFIPLIYIPFIDSFQHHHNQYKMLITLKSLQHETFKLEIDPEQTVSVIDTAHFAMMITFLAHQAIRRHLHLEFCAIASKSLCKIYLLI